MAPLPPQIRPRLSQLVRMLASDQDGEALAAARAIGRTLSAGGASFHDLAEAVGAASTEAASSPFVWDVWDPPEPVHKGPPSWHDLRDFERHDWLTAFVRKLDIPDKCGEGRPGPIPVGVFVADRDGAPDPAAARPVHAPHGARAWKVGVRP